MRKSDLLPQRQSCVVLGNHPHLSLLFVDSGWRQQCARSAVFESMRRLSCYRYTCDWPRLNNQDLKHTWWMYSTYSQLSKRNTMRRNAHLIFTFYLVTYWAVIVSFIFLYDWSLAHVYSCVHVYSCIHFIYSEHYKGNTVSLWMPLSHSEKVAGFQCGMWNVLPVSVQDLSGHCGFFLQFKNMHVQVDWRSTSSYDRLMTCPFDKIMSRWINIMFLTLQFSFRFFLFQ